MLYRYSEEHVKRLNDGWSATIAENARLQEQIEALRLTALREDALLAEVERLQAAQTPVRFSEREPEEDEVVLVWVNDTWNDGWFVVRYGDQKVLFVNGTPYNYDYASLYWLPYPPAPEVPA